MKRALCIAGLAAMLSGGTAKALDPITWSTIGAGTVAGGVIYWVTSGKSEYFDENNITYTWLASAYGAVEKIDIKANEFMANVRLNGPGSLVEYGVFRNAGQWSIPYRAGYYNEHSVGIRWETLGEAAADVRAWYDENYIAPPTNGCVELDPWQWGDLLDPPQDRYWAGGLVWGAVGPGEEQCSRPAVSVQEEIQPICDQAPANVFIHEVGDMCFPAPVLVPPYLDAKPIITAGVPEELYREPTPGSFPTCKAVYDPAWVTIDGETIFPTQQPVVAYAWRKDIGALMRATTRGSRAAIDGSHKCEWIPGTDPETITESLGVNFPFEFFYQETQ